jgi:hypothetical protein
MYMCVKASKAKSPYYNAGEAELVCPGGFMLSYSLVSGANSQPLSLPAF